MKGPLGRILIAAAAVALAPVAAFADTDYPIALTQLDSTRGACVPSGVPLIHVAGKTVTIRLQRECNTEMQADGNFACNLQGVNQPQLSVSGKISGANVDGVLTITGRAATANGSRVFNCASSFHGVAQDATPTR